MCLHQWKYVNDIVRDIRSQYAKVSHFPFPTSLKLDKDLREILSNPEQYRRLVGCLLYLALMPLDNLFHSNLVSTCKCPENLTLMPPYMWSDPLKGIQRKAFSFRSTTPSTFCFLWFGLGSLPYLQEIPHKVLHFSRLISNFIENKKANNS